jgi:hypothetical protein
MTGDNWADIARGLFETTGAAAGVAIFFVTFHLIVALVGPPQYIFFLAFAL